MSGPTIPPWLQAPAGLHWAAIVQECEQRGIGLHHSDQLVVGLLAEDLAVESLARKSASHCSPANRDGYELVAKAAAARIEKWRAQLLLPPRGTKA